MKAMLTGYLMLALLAIGSGTVLYGAARVVLSIVT